MTTSFKNGGSSTLKRPLAIIGAGLITLLLFLLATSKLIFLKSYSELEEREVEQSAKRVASSLSNELDQLNTGAGDYAGWDESYRFMRDGNEAFIKSNFTDETLSKLRLNVILFVEPSGRIIYEKGFDLNKGNKAPVPAGLHPLLSADSPLIRHASTESTLSGILLLPAGPLLVVSRPILTSDYKGPIRGALIMGRFLDSRETGRMAAISHLAIRFSIFSDPRMPADFQAVRSSIRAGTPSRILRLGPDEIAGYSLIRDVFGNPALILKVTIPRNLYRQGVTTVRYYILSVMGVGLLAAVLGCILHFKLALTQRKHLESEIRYQLLFENMLDGFAHCRMIYDSGGKPVDFIYLAVNSAFARLTALENVAGRRVTEIIPGIMELNPELFEIYGRVASTGKPERFETEFKPLGIWLSVSVYSTEKGSFIAIFDDITKRRKAEETLRRSNEELENRVFQRTAELSRTIEVLRQETSERIQAMEDLRRKDQMLIQQSRQAAMGEMIGNIAHQWRQPLNALGVLIQSMPITYDAGEFDREYLAGVEETAMQVISHMSQTINDFRNYFKPDKEKTPFPVSRAVSKTISLVEESFNHQQIAIQVETSDNPVVNGYPNEYSQVLLNILMNAKDAFSERAVEDPKIHINVCCEDNRSVVTVADNAGGIDDDIMDKIFEPYFSTKGPDKGTGVGLFMSKTIIEKNMNGKLTARNVGDGAEFRIEV